MTILALLFDAAYGLTVSMTVMLFSAYSIVPQFNSTGQAASPVKKDDASSAATQFATIKINQIRRANQPKLIPNIACNDIDKITETN